DAAHLRLLWQTLASLVDSPDATGDLRAHAFALPLVIVAAAAQPAAIPGALPDIGALHALFEAHNVLGRTRNFGFSNALCSSEVLEAIAPPELYRAVRDLDVGVLQALATPAAVAVAAGQESTHLRFIVGAGLAGAHDPGFTETASHIGAWGGDCSKL